MYFEVFIPILASIIGIIGGLLIARSKNRTAERLVQEKHKESMRSLALEIVKAEFMRAAEEGRISRHSIHAHWTVVKFLLEEHEVDPKDPNWVEIIDEASSYYQQICWPEKSLKKIGKRMNQLEQLKISLIKNPYLNGKRT